MRRRDRGRRYDEGVEIVRVGEGGEADFIPPRLPHGGRELTLPEIEARLAAHHGGDPGRGVAP